MSDARRWRDLCLAREVWDVAYDEWYHGGLGAAESDVMLAARAVYQAAVDAWSDSMRAVDRLGL